MTHLTAALTAALALPAASAWGAGFALMEQGGKGLGNAYAGAGAAAEDGSTVFFNPAGMTRLQGTELSGAGFVIHPEADFRNGSSTSALGGPLSGSDDDGGKIGLVPALYYTRDLGDGLKFGMGVNAPFGLATEYDRGWRGRYHAVESEVMTLNLNPSLAFKASETVSVGVGVSLQYIEAKLSNAIDYGTACAVGRIPLPVGVTCSDVGLSPMASDGFAEIEGDDWSFGYNLGLLFEPTAATRIGLSYRSKITHALSGDASLSAPPALAALPTSSAVTAGITLPESASLSLAHDINDRLTVLADVTWTRWSRFERLAIDFANPLLTDVDQPENWTNSRRYGIGVNYRHDASWTFRAGFAFDEEPIPSAELRTPRIPGNDRRWLALGASYRVNDRMSVDLGYAHLFVSDTPIDNTAEGVPHRLNGTYEAGVDIVGAQLNYRF